jgi:hypothetical protein
MPSVDLTANNTSLYMFCIISKRDLLYYIGKVCKKSVSPLIVSKAILKSIKPYIWRQNFIKPIIKGGCISNPSNYRSIALSSCMFIWETISQIFSTTDNHSL